MVACITIMLWVVGLKISCLGLRFSPDLHPFIIKTIFVGFQFVRTYQIFSISKEKYLYITKGRLNDLEYTMTMNHVKEDKIYASGGNIRG